MLPTALKRSLDALLAKQAPAGFWCGELQGDSILESEYLLLKWILGQEHEPELPLVANYLRRLQNRDGGWSLYPGGPADISGTVKGYFALKLMGDDPNALHMRRARELILELGGAEKCNTFTRFYFACLGQISFDACPSVPPEVVFLPKWFYFNLYHVSAWTRAMILPLGIVTTMKPVRHLPAHLGISELYVDQEAACRLSADPLPLIPRNWSDIFLRLDQLLKLYEQSPIASLREKALKQAEQWLLAHLSDGTEGLGAIFPPMVYLLIVFRLLGYADEHPTVVAAQQHLKDFMIRQHEPSGRDTIRLQPCFSPVWDTGIALNAVAEAGVGEGDDCADRAVDWLLSKECRMASDWRMNTPLINGEPVEPGGWYFEYNNPHYPDTDDTAMAARALARTGGERARPAIERAVNWLFAMQNDDGGWAAFDKTTDRPLLEKIPFADHNAMQDPSCPDIAARVIEGLGGCGVKVDHPAIQRAIVYLKRTQDECGAWWGRWGVNFIYGTWQTLCGLNSVGQNMQEPWIVRAADWLRSVQKADGSWGESCASYDDPALKGIGESTPSQTAWAVMGMMAVVGADDADVRRGIQWLVDHQDADGAWEEIPFTGTGFPRVFYLKYHLYRHYFPLMALARYRRLSTD